METQTFDKYNLRRVILEYPNQLELGQKFAEGVEVPKKDFKNLIICGMGGSSLPGYLLENYLINEGKFSCPIAICRAYDLPDFVGADSLILISSYSGNTEETVACFEKALKTEASIVAFSAGGKVEEIAKENNVPHVKYQIDFDHFQPRFATTYAFVAMQQVLTNIGMSAKIDGFPKIDVRSFEVQGEELAKKTKNKIPVIYTSDRFEAVSRLWKAKINENAKSPCFRNFFPEINHAEMLGFSLPSDRFFCVIFEDENDHPQVKKRIKITGEIYSGRGTQTEIIPTVGKNFLEKAMNAIVLGDWTAYYLAYEYQQDPTMIELVEEFKKML